MQQKWETRSVLWNHLNVNIPWMNMEWVMERRRNFQPSPEDKKPPQLDFELQKIGDVLISTETWSDDHLPIDILLLTAESCDFLSCFSLLDQPFKSYKFGIDYVYFGYMGDARDQEKLKVALVNCSKGAAAPGGSLTVVQNAVRVLGPKAVISVGTCISLGLEKARIGDVVISSRLITTEEFKTPASRRLGSLALDARYGWKAPLKDPNGWEIKVHCNGDMLSQSLREKCQIVNICERYPEAIAIETEGEGVYAAAYDANIEWLIVKGVASYFHQSQSATSEWMSFASAMAASVVAKMLNDPTVFQEWPRYNQAVFRGVTQRSPSFGGSVDYHLASAMDSQSRTKKNHGKRPIHPLGTTTPKRERQNTAFPKTENRGKRPIHPVGITTPKRRRQNAAFPETDIDISKVVDLLKREYNRRADFSPLLWSKGMKLQLKEVYTRLKVVSRRKAGSLEIDVDDIFKPNEEDNIQNIQLLLIEGSPGIGKTTFCLKLALDWANGAMPRNFPTFKLVFLLKCRDIIKDVVEEIFEQLLPEDLEEKIKEALANFLGDLNNQKQILIILDGLDELPEKSEDHVNKVLARKKLSFCYVLATTRQEKGIETRKQLRFDRHLAIEGFSEDDSFEYIRKHFRNIGTEHSSKGERLIEEVKQNPLLCHLQRNPLNLVLLCVVYEDHEGSLPSFITDLYQTIVRCLLRRYCAKEKLKASEKDEDLEKQFEIPILALGELAWKCLLNDRLSFYEDELQALERSNENNVARRLGLVYKEESLKRLKPRHAYSFLHKTFQEYLAASHIAHKFRGSEFQMLEQMLFPDIARTKFKQVFVFVCGIVREEANTLFDQIGKMLQKQWDSLECDRSTATFFADSWKETGNAERMAKTLCSFLPFPRPLHVWDTRQCDALSDVLEECSEFPEEMKVAEVHLSPDSVFYASFPDLFTPWDLKSLILYGSTEFGLELEDVDKTLIEKLTFALFADVGKGVSKVPDFGLSSIRLRICGSLGSSSLQEVENLLLHKCLCSLSITVCGDAQESLVEALARGLAGESAVKFLDLCVNGKFSFRGAYLLEEGILRNRSLRNVKISVNGEPPENWQVVAKNLRAQFSEKAIVSEIYPNTFSKVKDSQVTHMNRLLPKTDLKQQTVTLNVWGELSGDSFKAVCEVLLHAPVSHLKLNVRGQLADEILRYIARCVEEQEKLLPITINAWVDMTEKEKKVVKELGLDKNPLFSLNVRGTSAPLKESSDSKAVSSDEPQSLIAFHERLTEGPSQFTEDSSQKSLTIKINDDKSNEWEHGLGEGDTSLKSLTLEIESFGDTGKEWGRDLGKGLAGNTALESLTIKMINSDCDKIFEWELGLGDGLARNTSLKSLTLEIERFGDTGKEWGRDLGEGLARNSSLESLTIKVNHDIEMIFEWEHGLGDGLARNTSLKSLTLEIDDYYFDIEWGSGIGEGLARNTSLKSLTLAINNGDHGHSSNKWRHVLFESLVNNNSLNLLTLTINNYSYISDEWGAGLAEGLARNTSLKSITLTINNYFYVNSVWGLGLFEGSARNMSLKSITLSINNYGLMKGERRHDIIEGLARNASLASITLAINNYGDMKGEWGHCLFEGLARNTSLNSLTLTANNYGNMSEEGARGCALRECLRKRGSLTECNLIVDICGKC
ncbi:LOW QUALITY PROTEIN: uncharacterized protein LOC114949279 [Acropora millepora]|uniref:LOW QUALITY PROTEIN: uncharacterized protein LOC114949279 n=1 Tax=Acropora millepora TaxID=45264 RepID=UPI001CF37D79|nr:LOW QUALITY PROTEIN: uncharacterized protein LOC114949279 [Acropora millepora]